MDGGHLCPLGDSTKPRERGAKQGWFRTRFTFTPWINIHYIGSDRDFNMRNLNTNAPLGYFPLQTMPSQSQPETSISKVKRRIWSGFTTSVHHFQKHVGVGIVCSVAYFDPYATHLKAEAGYWTIVSEAIGVLTSKLGRVLVIGPCFSSSSWLAWVRFCFK